MAKERAEKTAAQKAYENAKAAHEKALAALEKADNAANKKAEADAATALAGARKVLTRENFVRVGGNRMAKAVEAIANVGKVAKPKTYDFSEADIAKIETALNASTAATVAAFRNASTKTGKGEKKAAFAF